MTSNIKKINITWLQTTEELSNHLSDNEIDFLIIDQPFNTVPAFVELAAQYWGNDSKMLLSQTIVFCQSKIQESQIRGMLDIYPTILVKPYDSELICKMIQNNTQALWDQKRKVQLHSLMIPFV